MVRSTSVLQEIQARRFACAFLVTAFLHSGMPLTFASDTRVVGSDQSQFIKGAQKPSKKQMSRSSAHRNKPKALWESDHSTTKGQPAPLITGKTEALHSALLEETIPEIASLTAKIISSPEDSENHFALATCYRRLGVFDKALEEYQKAIGLDPGNAEFHEGLAGLWKDGGIPKSSFEELDKSLQLKPDSVSAWSLLGTLYDDQGDLAHALACYRTALGFKQDLDYLHSNLCFAYLRTGSLENAILHGEEATRLNPNNKVAYNNLGVACAMAGDKDRALMAFKRGGDEASAHNNLGLVLLRKNKPGEAMEQFKIAIRLRPFYTLAAENYRLARSLKVELERHGGKSVGKVGSEGG